MASKSLRPAASLAREANEPGRLSAAGTTHVSSQRENVSVLIQDRPWSVVTGEHERDTLLVQFKPRELDILQLLAQGLDTATMAQRLDIAAHTVEWHLAHVIEKLHIRSNFQAIVDAARKGLIQL